MKVFISGTAGFGINVIKSLPKTVNNYIIDLVSKNCEILIGDCMGIDSLVQTLLNELNYNDVTVYYSGNKCRNLINNGWKAQSVVVPYGVTSRAFYAVKDKAMADDADFGVAVWDGKSQGTGTNIENLKAQGKIIFVYRTDKQAWEVIQP